MRLFEFAGGVAEADDVLRGAFAYVTDVASGAWGAGDAFAVGTGEGRAVGHPEVAGLALFDLELDGSGPDLLLPLDAVEDATVAGLPLAFAEGALAPFEVGAKVEAVEGLPGEEIAHLVAGDVDDAVLDLEDVLGVGVEAAPADEGVELGQV